MANLSDLKKELNKYKNSKRAEVSQRFFKTGKGEYAEGDIFLGLAVPQVKSIAKKFYNLPLPDIKKLLASKIHEERHVALFILIDGFQKGSKAAKKQIFKLYCDSAECVNNWDLVDCSADKIIGCYLFGNPKPEIIISFAKSSNLWKRRIGIMATWYFVRKNSFDFTFQVAEILLQDKHDLIHKATGWMLREVGKRDLKKEEDFLRQHHSEMPRTMLRYAIEKFPERKRKKYLNGKV